MSCLIVASLLAACAAEAPTPSSAAPTPSSAAPEPSAAAPEASAEAPAEKIKIGFTFPTKNNEFWSKSLDFVNYVAGELGIEVIAQDCDNKQEKQVNDVDNMIAAGIKGLVLAPQDASVCPGIVQKCK